LSLAALDSVLHNVCALGRREDLTLLQKLHLASRKNHSREHHRPGSFRKQSDLVGIGDREGIHVCLMRYHVLTGRNWSQHDILLLCQRTRVRYADCLLNNMVSLGIVHDRR
jgi:hypothetical protein